MKPPCGAAHQRPQRVLCFYAGDTTVLCKSRDQMMWYLYRLNIPSTVSGNRAVAFWVWFSIQVIDRTWQPSLAMPILPIWQWDCVRRGTASGVGEACNKFIIMIIYSILIFDKPGGQKQRGKNGQKAMQKQLWSSFHISKNGPRFLATGSCRPQKAISKTDQKTGKKPQRETSYYV